MARHSLGLLGPAALGLMGLLNLPACDTSEDDALSTLLDTDNDGFTQDQDCDDTDPTIHPEAYEDCSSVDRDCSGDPTDNEPHDALTWFVDADGDGYGDPDNIVLACEQPSNAVENPFDCNDEAAEAYPYATEVCDDLDNDCDGTIDEASAEDAATWYADSDGDGYGTEFAIAYGCVAPSGFVDNSDDCNDTDDTINPDGTEICEGHYDEDCDDLFEEADDDISDAEDPTLYGADVFYVDADGDGYGDPDTATVLCELTTGYVDNDLDCDDTLNLVNPGQAESCGNNLDDNCDGSADEEDAPYHVQWYTDADSDGYGDPDQKGPVQCSEPSGFANNAGDCNDAVSTINPGETEIWYDGTDQDCDGRSDYDADYDAFDAQTYGGFDCDDTTDQANPGMVEICGDGIDNDCDGTPDPCGVDATLVGANTNDQLGVSVSSAGDWDGDGRLDLMVGADRFDDSGTARGAVWLILGELTGDHTVTSRDSAQLVGEDDQDLAGGRLAAVGDMDDSGYSTVAIGALGDDDGGTEAGAVYLVSGPSLSSYTLSSAQAKLVGEVAYDEAGAALAAAGDVDGDGYADLLVGASGFDAAGTDSGAAYLLLGPVTADMDLSYANSRFGGEAAGDAAGAAVGGGKDLDGDGLDDMIVGAPYAQDDGSYVGAAYVVLGPTSDNTLTLDEADGRSLGEASGDQAGFSVAATGDMDGDGLADVIVGAPGSDTGGTTAGAVYLLSGADVTDGDHPMNEAHARIVGTSEDDWVGYSVSALGDMNVDGAPDFLFGARYIDTTQSDAGAAYVVFGPLSGNHTLSRADLAIQGTNASDEAGAAIAGVGDMDSDGSDDVLVGIPGSDDGAAEGGAVLMVLGSVW